MVFVSKSFAEVFNDVMIMKEMYCEVQGAVIRYRDTRVVLMGAKVAHSSEVVILRVDTLCVNLNSI